MANNWNIPYWLEKEVRERDHVCVYCGVEFTPAKVSKKSAPKKIMNLRDQLVNIALKWQNKYGVAPAITSAISEYDAAMAVGRKGS